MAQVIADRCDLEFVLYEQMEIETLLAYEKYADFNRKMFDMIISEARNFAIKELLPTYAEGDKIGLKFEKGQVKVPECFHRSHELLIEGEWTSPKILTMADKDYRIVSANIREDGFDYTGRSGCCRDFRSGFRRIIIVRHLNLYKTNFIKSI